MKMKKHLALLAIFVLLASLSLVNIGFANPFQKIQETEFNQAAFTTKYSYQIKSILPEKGTANFKRWDNNGNLFYLIFSRTENAYPDHKENEIQLWSISPITLARVLVSGNVQSRFLSRDASQVAYIENRMLVITNVGSGVNNHKRSFSIPKSKNLAIATWSPNNNEILLYDASQSFCTLWTLNIESGKFKKIDTMLSAPLGCGNLVSWSPDSKNLFYPASTKAKFDYLITSVAELSKTAIHVLDLIPEPSWTVPNSILFYQYNLKDMELQRGAEDVKEDDFSELLLIDIQKRRSRKIFTQNRRSDFYPVQSPDGKHVAFYGRDRNGRTKLMLTTIKGEYCIALDDNVTPGQPPVWSGDSNMVAYDKMTSSGRIAIGLVILSPKQ